MTARILIPSASIIALALTSSATAQADQLAQIRQGKIIATSVPGKSGPQAGRATALIEAPAEVVADVVADLANYSQFVPRVEGSRKIADGRYLIQTKLPWPLNKTWAYISLARKKQQALHYLSWRMINGTLRSFNGMAWIQPVDSKRSVLTYQMLAVPYTTAPDGLITRGLRNGAKDMIKAVRKRSAKVLAQRQQQSRRLAAH